MLLTPNGISLLFRRSGNSRGRGIQTEGKWHRRKVFPYQKAPNLQLAYFDSKSETRNMHKDVALWNPSAEVQQVRAKNFFDQTL